MPIFSLTGCTLAELFSKPANWRQIYKQRSSTFHTSNEAMYNTRTTGTGNGMRGTRGMWGILYSGKSRQTFRGMSSNILGNVTKYSGECRQIFREWYQTIQGMSSNIPGNVSNILGNVTKHSGECHETVRGMSPNIPGNVAKYSGEWYQTIQGMSPNIPGNVIKHSGECCQFLV